MSHLTPGLIGAYNSLTDKHLTTYFNNVRIRRHLQRVGLISRSGRIVSEKEFRYKIIHRDQQRHVRECLAQAIFHRVLDMERLHQTEIRRKLEEFARRERVNKIKVERCNRYEEDPLIVLSPRPPTRLRSSHTQHSGPERELSDSTDSLGSSRPNTAPEKSQRPVRLKPLNSNSTPTSTKRNSSQSQNHDLTNDREQPINCMLDRDVMRHLTLTDFSSTVSPYRLPVINNFVTPVPPLKKKEKVQNGTLRGRRLRPTTAPNDAPDTKEGAVQRVWSRSVVWVKMVYFGKSVHLSHDLMELKDEVKVFQQHCGGENLCVYKGRLKEGESFQFVSRRHRGFPFSLTFYLNGLQVERLSSCCEFKHRKNSRLGGRHAHFGFTGVEGAAPCYRCIIALGLDKKPTPPKRTRNNQLLSKSWENGEEEEKHLQSEASQSHSTETKRNTNQEHKHKNGYEEDFEADDEGPMDDGLDEGNETSPSLSREEKEERRKDENGNDDLNRNSQKGQGSSTVSSGLSSSSSSSEEDDEFDEEQKEEEEKIHTATLTSEKDAQETEVLQRTSMSHPTEEVPQNQEIGHIQQEDQETEEPREEPQEVEKHTDETGEPEECRNEPGEAEEPKEEQGSEEQREEHEEAEEAREELREETPGGMSKEVHQTKSVQEKLAEAMLNMTECGSEPELSDTTTEEDEVMSPGVEPENTAAQQTAEEENGAESVQETEREGSHTEEPKEELKKETHETPQPGKETEEEEEEDTNKTEVKTQNSTKEDEYEQDEQNNCDDENEDQNQEVNQYTTDEEEGQKQEDNNFTNEEDKSNEEPEMMEKPEDEEPPDEVPKAEESFEQKPENEAISENSINAEGTRATPVEKDVNIIEEITEHQPGNLEEISMDPENMDQNTEIEKVSDEGLSGGEKAEDTVTEEVKADEKETADVSRNLQNNSEETRNDITKCTEEGNMEDAKLELMASSMDEVKGEDMAGEEEKFEERVEVLETEGEKEHGTDGDEVQTDVKDGVEEVKDQDPQVKKDESTEERNKDEEKINEEMTEDRTEQKELTSTGQSSEENADDDVGEEEREEELAAEKEAELGDEQKSGSEGNDMRDDQHEEELKENKLLKETEGGENEIQDISEGGEERTDVSGAYAEMQNIVMEEENKEEQKDNSAPTVHEGLQETTDGPEVKSGEIDAENGEEIVTVDQQEFDKKEEAGPGEGDGSSKSNAEETNRDMTTEGDVKDEQTDNDNEKKDQKEIQQETNNKEEEVKDEQKVGEETEQKQYMQKERTNDEEIKDEQKDEVENVKPEVSENSNDVANEDETTSGGKNPAEDPAGAESEPKDMNVDFESRAEEDRGAGDTNNIQSSTDMEKDQNADAAEETRSVEGSTSPSEESQPLEKVQAIKREEREAELIIAPRTDHEELVSNWVNVHQASNYFETFVEPLDEIKILDGERTINAEALESPKESNGNEELSKTVKDEQISLPANSEHEEPEDTLVENFNMETDALGFDGQRNPSSSNPSEEENQRQINSEQTPEDLEDAAVNNVMNFSATPLMKIEISQDS